MLATIRDDVFVQPRRVLVVDDDPDLRFMLRVLLDRAGESVVVAEAGNGKDAITAALEHRPDVIVLDEMMPVMSGTEAIPSLRDAVPEARIVIYSAAAAAAKARSEPAAADAYLAKGTPLTELLAAVAA